jgi:hypothetical protein
MQSAREGHGRRGALSGERAMPLISWLALPKHLGIAFQRQPFLAHL